jgi:hypothetical protein
MGELGSELEVNDQRSRVNSHTISKSEALSALMYSSSLTEWEFKILTVFLSNFTDHPHRFVEK